MSYIGVDAFRAYRVMMTLIRSLWFIEDARTKCAKDIKKEIKDQKFEDLVNWFNNHAYLFNYHQYNRNNS